MSKNLLRSVILFALVAVFALSGISFADDSFEYHGYMRSGFSFNESLAAPRGNIQAPNAPMKYRLGNEQKNTYIENSFVKNWKDDDGTFMKFVFRAAWTTQERQNWASEGDSGVVREAYIQGGGFEMNKDMKVWAGDRFYAREDIHINDFYYRDLSGYGAGFEDIALGFAKLNVAWIANRSDDNAVDSDGVTLGNQIAHNFDIQLNEIKVPGGSFNFEVDTIYLVGALDADTGNNEANEVGFFFEGSYNLASFLGFSKGFTKIVGQYGMGPGGNEWGFGNASGALWSSTANNNGKTIADMSRYRVMLWGVMEASENLSMMPVLIYDVFDNGDTVEKTWISAGLRTKMSLNRNLAMQLEVGYDQTQQVESTGPVTGTADPSYSLLKVTVAPTFTFDTGFWTRPEIRFYATYGKYMGDTKDEGLGSGVKEAGKDDSVMQFGAQAEAWW